MMALLLPLHRFRIWVLRNLLAGELTMPTGMELNRNCEIFVTILCRGPFQACLCLLTGAEV